MNYDGLKLYKKFVKPFRKYNPEKYWKNAGEVQKDESLKKQGVSIVEHILSLEFDTVFELGVGEGRITEPILKNKKISLYDSIDYTPTRIDIIKEKLKSYPQFTVTYGNFQSVNIKKKYDLVLASEVLMHITPKDIKNVIEKMLQISSKYVISIDWLFWYFPYCILGNMCHGSKFSSSTIFFLSLYQL